MAAAALGKHMKLKPYSAQDPPREEVGPSLVGQNKDEGTKRVVTDDSSLESQATGINPTSERWQLVEIPQPFHNNAVDVNTDEESVCHKCGIETLSAGKKPISLCKICSETREMWKKSGAWFFKLTEDLCLFGMKRLQIEAAKKLGVVFSMNLLEKFRLNNK
uniref:FYVE-type zinc finger domain-containing protein n=1 Tax=Timema genevievae TaxID=629358 RepID=A0A7R9PHF4_TIMGE|nr:unnamed protein product [Timema genevievae]